MSNLSLAAAAAFSLAAREAEQLGSASIDVEHLFLGLCRVESLKSWGASDWPVKMGEAEIRDLRQESEIFTGAMDRGGLNVISARRRMRELWHDEHPQRELFSGHRTPCLLYTSDAADE